MLRSANIIGSRPNGLAAAITLAQRGVAVSVNGEKFSGKSLSRDALGDAPTLRLGKRAVRIQWTA